MLFFSTSLDKSLKDKFNYGNKLRASKSYNLIMKLPIKNIKNRKPDYDYMEILISAIQKLVIKDVVLYADKKINATKTIVKNE